MTNTNTSPDTLVISIAASFASRLRSAVGDEGLTRVVDLNAREVGTGACHSHDFVDANDVMIEAFLDVMDRHMDASSETDANLVNEAWNLAGDSRFDVETIETAHLA